MVIDKSWRSGGRSQLMVL